MSSKVRLTRDAVQDLETLFEIENAETVTVVAVRHQLEDDYH